MRCVWALAALQIGIILVAGIGTSIPDKPHEEYSKAQMDMRILALYLRDALDMLNLSVSYGALDDIVNSSYYSDAFGDKVLRAISTLEGIPQHVDSRRYLQEQVDVLIEGERNLSLAIEYWNNLTMYQMHLSQLSSANWTRASLEENLTRLDRAVPGIQNSRSMMLEALKGLNDNLRGISDIDLGRTLDNLNRWTQNIQAIEVDDIGYGDHLHVFFTPLIMAYSNSIDNVTLEGDPDPDLGQMAILLRTSSGGLSIPLSSIIAGFTRNIIEPHSTLLMMRKEQISFISDLASLRRSIDLGSGILEQYSYLSSAAGHLSAMEEGMVALESAYSAIEPHDDGSVKGSLRELRDLIGSYRDNITGVELIFSDIERLSSLLGRVIRDNAIPADPDLDGIISLQEALLLSYPQDVLPALRNASYMLENISSILSKLDPVTAMPYQGSLKGLRALYQNVDSFSHHHIDLISNIMTAIFALLEDEYNSTEVDRTLMDAAALLNSMHLSLDGIRTASDHLVREGLEGNEDGMEDLDGLLRLYDDLLLLVLFEADMDEGLFLSLNRNDAPYDDEVLIGILIVERASDGFLSFPASAKVILSLDGLAIDSIDALKGKGRYLLTVERSLEPGPHILNASTILKSGTRLSDNASFIVRKLETRIVHYPSEPVIRPLENVEIEIFLMDELSRPVVGNITVSGIPTHVAGSIALNLTYDTTGAKRIPLEYAGDPFRSPSNGLIDIEVSIPPVIEVDISASVFMIGDKIPMNVTCRTGEGALILLSSSHSIDLGGAHNGSVIAYSLDSNLLGIGLHPLSALLISGSPWCRDGESNLEWITVLSPEEYIEWEEKNRPPPPIVPIDPPVEPPDDPPNNDQDPIGPLDPADPPGKKLGSGLLIVSVVLLSALVISFLFVVIHRKRRDKTPISDHVHAGNDMGTGPSKGLPIGSVKDTGTLRGAKQRLIASFIDTVDSSPPKAGVGRHMTMREVSRRLTDLKAPHGSEDVLIDLEAGIYSKSSVDDEKADGIILKVRSIGSWLITSFMGAREKGVIGGSDK